MKVFSIRLYKNKKVISEILAENLDKELRKKLKLPKEKPKTRKIEDIKDYDDIRLIVYSNVKKTGIKKSPDLTEIGLNGSLEEKTNFAKEHLSKEIHISDVFEKNQTADIRGLTKGKGFQGPVKRFGIKLRFHKSEKGVRKVGSIGPWHPARTIFKAPMAGQLGMFTRINYNNKIVDIKKSSEENPKAISNYGDIKTDYILTYGSANGPAKRQLLLTHPLRATRKQSKKTYELIQLR